MFDALMGSAPSVSAVALSVAMGAALMAANQAEVATRDAAGLPSLALEEWVEVRAAKRAPHTQVGAGREAALGAAVSVGACARMGDMEMAAHSAAPGAGNVRTGLRRWRRPKRTCDGEAGTALAGLQPCLDFPRRDSLRGRPTMPHGHLASHSPRQARSQRPSGHEQRLRNLTCERLRRRMRQCTVVPTAAPYVLPACTAVPCDL